jgi:hypothetical protein
MNALAVSLIACLLAVVTACARPEGVLAASAGAPGTPCTSSADCAKGAVCTTEDGVCNPAPSCGPGRVCPAVCYGTCRPASGPSGRG